MSDSAFNQPPYLGPHHPTYPQVNSFCRVYGPPIIPGAKIYQAFASQYLAPNTLRDREDVYVWEPNNISLPAGFYNCRLVGNLQGLPLYATNCCFFGSSSSSSFTPNTPLFFNSVKTSGTNTATLTSTKNPFDLLIAFVTFVYGTSTSHVPPTPPGWDVLSFVFGGGVAPFVVTYVYFQWSNTGGVYTSAWTSDSAIVANVITITGASGIDVYVGGVGGGTNLNAPSITTNGDNELILVNYGEVDITGSLLSYTLPGTLTSAGTQSQAGTQGFDVSETTGYAYQPIAGPTGILTATGASGTAKGASFNLAIR